MSIRLRSRHASIAAEPVSPLVAPTIVTRSPPRGQHVVEQAAEHLHRHVLEGQRRSVEQFERPQIGLQLDQRHDRRVGEPGIRLAAHRLQGGKRHGVADEGLHDPGCQLGVGQAT